MLNVYASNDRFYRLVYIVKRFLFAFYRFWALGFNLLSQSRPSPHFSLSSLHPPVSFSFFSLSVSFALTVASYRRRFRFLSPPPLSLSLILSPLFCLPSSFFSQYLCVLPPPLRAPLLSQTMHIIIHQHFTTAESAMEHFPPSIKYHPDYSLHAKPNKIAIHVVLTRTQLLLISIVHQSLQLYQISPALFRSLMRSIGCQRFIVSPKYVSQFEKFFFQWLF